MKTLLLITALLLSGCASMNQQMADLDPTNPNSAVSKQLSAQAAEREKNCRLTQATRDFCDAEDQAKREIIEIEHNH
jgi:starvation-inducible outer membrane lipoprotein